tara:strand:- start:3493 stop:3744 length:252 start_codon:yes stop_codon:yes gene_type:complete
MTNLNDLIGVKVTFEMEIENNGKIESKFIPCKIECAYLDTYAFDEKQEQMNVFANIMPLDTNNLDDYDSEDFAGIALSDLRKL